jgi:hypothetical protein
VFSILVHFISGVSILTFAQNLLSSLFAIQSKYYIQKLNANWEVPQYHLGYEERVWKVLNKTFLKIFKEILFFRNNRILQGHH